MCGTKDQSGPDTGVKPNSNVVLCRENDLHSLVHKDLTLSTSIIFERIGSDDFDAMLSCSNVSVSHIQFITVRECLLDHQTIRSLLTLISRKFSNLRHVALVGCHWKYSAELHPLLSTQFAHDGDLSKSRKTVDTENVGSRELTALSAIHIEMFASTQFFIRGLFKSAPLLFHFEATEMGLDCLYRPFTEFQCQQSFISTLFSLSSSLKTINLSSGGLCDALFRRVRPLWGAHGLLKLETFCLAKNKLTDQGLLYLLTLDEDCKHVGRNESLKLIGLSQNQIQLVSDNTMEVVKRCLACNENLKIVLSGNPISRQNWVPHPQIEFVEMHATPPPLNEETQNSWVDLLLNQSYDDEDSEEYVLTGSDSAVADSSSEEISLASEGSDLYKLLQE